MPVWSWFFIAAAVLIALTLVMLAVLSVTSRRKTRRLKKNASARNTSGPWTRPVVSAPLSRSSWLASGSERSSTSSHCRRMRTGDMPSSGTLYSVSSSTIRRVRWGRRIVS